MEKTELINYLDYFTLKFSKKKLKKNSKLELAVDNFINDLKNHESLIGPSYIWDYFCFSFRNLIENKSRIGSSVYSILLNKNKIIDFHYRDKKYDYIFKNDNLFYIKYNISKSEFDRIYISSSYKSVNYTYFEKMKIKFSKEENGFLKCLINTNGFKKNDHVCCLCIHKKICSKIS